MTRPTLLPLRRSRARRLVAVPAAVAAVAAPTAGTPADAAPVAARLTASPASSSTGSGVTMSYVVQPGDTLTSIAARTGTDIATLVRLNGLAHPDQLLAGMRLLVPVQVTVRRPTPPPAPRAVSYTVRAGDSVWAIAVRSGCTVAAIIDANGLPADGRIVPGQILLLPGADLPATPPPRPKPSTPVRVHVVAAGETLSGIAQHYHLGLSVLLRANRLATDAVIRPGQKLVLPGVPVVGVRRPVPAPTHGYVVRRGDTLSGIAFTAGIPLTTLTALNHLPAATVIVPGQRLLLPGTAPTPAQPPVTVTVSEPGGGRTVRQAAAINRAVLVARPVPTPARVRALVRAAALALGVDPALALAVADAESGFDQRRVSPANAIGVMQVVPSSGRWAAAVLGRPLDLLDATDNITAGVAVLAALRPAGGDDVVVAAYYQGLDSVRRHGLYADTRRYVADVLTLRGRYQ
jgi:LysM repeat protein